MSSVFSQSSLFASELLQELGITEETARERIRGGTSGGTPEGPFRGTPVWIATDEGYTPTTLREIDTNGRIILEDGTSVTGEIHVRGEPSSVDDLTALPQMHPPSVLDTLRRRYATERIYTFSGPNLIALNPYKRIEIPPDCPHVNAIADQAYRGLTAFGECQSIIVSGESGAGKTETTKILLAHLAQKSSTLVAGEQSHSTKDPYDGRLQPFPGTHNNFLEGRTAPEGAAELEVTVDQKLLGTTPILESFGNAKTLRNDNSSRFGKFVVVDFSKEGGICGARLATYLLEKSRVVRHAPGERGYHIFYQLCKKALSDPEYFAAANKWNLAPPSSYRCLKPSGADPERSLSPRRRTTSSARHTPRNSDHQRSQSIGAHPVSRATLARSSTTPRSRESADTPVREIDDAAGFDQTAAAFEKIGLATPDGTSGRAALEAILGVVVAIMDLGNVDFQSNEKDEAEVEIKDRDWLGETTELLGADRQSLNEILTARTITVGEENFRKRLNVAESQTMRDSLAMFLYDRLFAWIVDGINASMGHSTSDHFIGILDIYGFECFENNSFEQFCINYANERIQQQFVEHVLREEQKVYEQEGVDWKHVNFTDNSACIRLIEGNMGLLSLLDEETRFPKATAESFVHKVRQKHQSNPCFVGEKGECDTLFTLRHYPGTVPYDATGFLEKNKSAMPPEFATLNVTNSLVRELLCYETGATGRTTIATQFRTSLDDLLETIAATQPSYIRCIKPNDEKLPFIFSPLRVLEQLRCGGVVEALRVAQAGYPVRLDYSAFIDRYWQLASVWHNRDAMRSQRDMDAKGAKEYLSVSLIFETARLTDPTQAQLGHTRIFLKSGALAQLEDVRVTVIHTAATIIQRYARRRHAVRRATERKHSIVVLQMSMRSHIARCCATKLLRRLRAVVCIQNAIRSAVARRMLHLRLEQQQKEVSQQIKEQQAKEQQIKEQQEKEKQEKDKQLKEQQLKEQQEKEKQVKEQQLKEQQIKETEEARRRVHQQKEREHKKKEKSKKRKVYIQQLEERNVSLTGELEMVKEVHLEQEQRDAREAGFELEVMRNDLEEKDKFCGSLEETLKYSQNELSATRNVIATLQSEVSVQKALIDTLTKENQDISRKYLQSSQDKAYLEEQKNLFERDAVNRAEDQRQYLDELSLLRIELQNAYADVTDARQKLADYDNGNAAEWEQLQRWWTELGEEHTRISAEREERRKSVEEIRQALDEARREQTRNTALEEEVRDLDSKMNELTLERNSVSEKLIVTQEKYVRLQENSRDEEASLRKTIAALHADVDATNEELDDLTRERGTMDEKLRSLMELMDTNNSEISRLHTELRGSKAAQIQLQLLKSQLKQKQEEIVKYASSDDADVLRRQLQAAESQLSILQAEMRSKCDDLDGLTEQLSHLTQINTQLQIQHDTAIRDCTAAKEALQGVSSILRTGEAELRSLREEIATQVRSLQQKEEELCNKDEEIATLTAKSAKVNELIQQMRLLREQVAATRLDRARKGARQATDGTGASSDDTLVDSAALIAEVETALRTCVEQIVENDERVSRLSVWKRRTWKDQAEIVCKGVRDIHRTLASFRSDDAVDTENSLLSCGYILRARESSTALFDIRGHVDILLPPALLGPLQKKSVRDRTSIIVNFTKQNVCDDQSAYLTGALLRCCVGNDTELVSCLDEALNRAESVSQAAWLFEVACLCLGQGKVLSPIEVLLSDVPLCLLQRNRAEQLGTERLRFLLLLVAAYAKIVQRAYAQVWAPLDAYLEQVDHTIISTWVGKIVAALQLMQTQLSATPLLSLFAPGILDHVQRLADAALLNRMLIDARLCSFVSATQLQAFLAALGRPFPRSRQAVACLTSTKSSLGRGRLRGDLSAAQLRRLYQLYVGGALGDEVAPQIFATLDEQVALEAHSTLLADTEQLSVELRALSAMEWPRVTISEGLQSKLDEMLV